MDKDIICVEVAYGTPEGQALIELRVAPGTTLIEAIELSGIRDQFPEINLENSRKGIFGRIAKDDRVLIEHDRVEIYRPLAVDPKEARRRRANKGTKT